MMMVRMMMMMSVVLADANEQISAGSPRIGTGVNIFTKASTPSFFLFTSADLLKFRSATE